MIARPVKKTVDYFPHQCKHAKTMFVIEQRFGNDGYAFWFKLLELIGSSDGHYIDLNNPADWEYLTATTRIDDSLCCQILDLLARLDAIDQELWLKHKVVWSQNFVDGIADAYRNRKSGVPTRDDVLSNLRKKPTSGEVSGVRDLPSEEFQAEPSVINSQTKLDYTKLDKTKRKDSPDSSYSNQISTVPEDIYIMSKNEEKFLSILKNIKNYPLDTVRDIEMYRTLQDRYAQLDLVEALKDWRTYKLDKPLTEKSNARAQINNAFRKYLEWGRCLKIENKKNDDWKYRKFLDE